MPFDLARPIGILFLTYGGLLTGHGILRDDAGSARFLGHSVDLEWGLVLTAFGSLMLVLGLKRTHSSHDENRGDEDE